MDAKKLRVLVIGAHQDDPEKMGGTAIKLARAGHVVKFLCATNGQSGHQEYPGYKTVQLRAEEKRRSKEVLGIAEYESLDMSDGYLTTDIPSRERMMRAIREFNPDMIFTHRPCDYHPDHRNTGMLVQDCSYLLRVPNFLPTVPVMEKLPLIFYMEDTFQKPYSFQANVIVAIDDVIGEKLRAYAQHVSQMYEWLPWVDGIDLATVPQDEDGRMKWLENRYLPRSSWQKDKYFDLLVSRYGKEAAAGVHYCEAFEACEYGASHKNVDYSRIFPR